MNCKNSYEIVVGAANGFLGASYRPDNGVAGNCFDI